MHLFWTVMWAFVILVFVAFTFVIAFGAPFLPTLKAQVPNALGLIDLKPGQTLLELGSGDGRILAAAAEQGLTTIGYELNPALVVYSWARTRKYGKKVKIIWGNYWSKKLPQADGIFVFLLQPYMEKLDTKIIQECDKPVKLVSFAFHVPNKRPTKKLGGMYLYVYK
jgi:16S rRNA A1518/A1519 N6-dimethyltransferase RsmA/KsgA/DIM1 with predicted DNA glycosylase/AP lyase activity